MLSRWSKLSITFGSIRTETKRMTTAERMKAWKCSVFRPHSSQHEQSPRANPSRKTSLLWLHQWSVGMFMYRSDAIEFKSEPKTESDLNDVTNECTPIFMRLFWFSPFSRSARLLFSLPLLRRYLYHFNGPDLLRSLPTDGMTGGKSEPTGHASPADFRRTEIDYYIQSHQLGDNCETHSGRSPPTLWHAKKIHIYRQPSVNGTDSKQRLQREEKKYENLIRHFI